MKNKVVFYDFSEIGKNVNNRYVGGFEEEFNGKMAARVRYLNQDTVCAFSDSGLTFISVKNVIPDPEVITVEVEEDAEGLIIVASNDFTRREASLSGGTNTGSFEGLKPNMSYKITVEQTSAFGGSIAEESVTTLTAEEAPVTALYSVTSECTCNIDGCFHFTMELVDEKGIWSEYEATLTDKKGTVSSCVFSQEITAEQVIDVVGAPLVGKTAQFVISCYDSELGQRRQLYSAEVKI